MGFLNKISIIIFSVLMLILSVVGCLIIFGWLSVSTVASFLTLLLASTSSTMTVLGLIIVCMLLSIRGIFFDIDEQNKMKTKDGILLENSDGKLLITKETLENLVNNVIKGFENVERASSRVELDSKTNTLIVNSVLTVKQGTVIKELTKNLQQRIRETIKKSSDLDVKEVNISIKKIEN